MSLLILRKFPSRLCPHNHRNRGRRQPYRPESRRRRCHAPVQLKAQQGCDPLLVVLVLFRVKFSKDVIILLVVFIILLAGVSGAAAERTFAFLGASTGGGEVVFMTVGTAASTSMWTYGETRRYRRRQAAAGRKDAATAPVKTIE